MTLALLGSGPVLLLLAAWAHRWTSDDGFINVRIVEQIFAGNGPVFNDGERVEAGTSPAWILLVVVGRVVLFWLPIEWVMVVLSTASAVGAVGVAQLAGVRLLRTSAVMPFAIVAFLALPPVWDFSTSGLENGLSFLWIAGCQLGLVAAGRSSRDRTTLCAAVVIGLGPLVRPDFVVISAVLGLALVLVTWSGSWRRVAKAGAAALAVPAAYELFRITYYGALLPNTAYAKEATGSNWAQGRLYLEDFTDPYALWFPVAAIAAILILGATRRPTSENVLWLASPAGGLLYAVLVVRAGADQMHGRMLLPALFAMVLPLAVIPRRPRNVVAVVAVLVWALVPLRSGGPPYDGRGPDRIADERSAWADDSGDHPVTLDDYRTRRATWLLVAAGDGAAKAAEAGERVLVTAGTPILSFTTLRPLADSVRHDVVLAATAVGMTSVAAGPEVHVADVLNLADPVGAHFALERRGWPGHEKVTPMAWVVARYLGSGSPLPPSIAPADVALARRALRCPLVRDLQARATARLTLGRAVRNAVDSFRLHGTRIDPAPTTAASTCTTRSTTAGSPD